jgi:hypothetical protein
MRKFEDGPGILEEWVYITPIFGTLPLDLGRKNIPFFMELGDFSFFPIFLVEIRIHQGLYIHHWDFCLIKK